MRYERKFIISPSRLLVLNSFIKSLGFIRSFPDRYVSSIYYDDPLLSQYYDSLNGVSNRTKIRARYYNRDFQTCKFEIKYKNAELGAKAYPELSELNSGSLSKITFHNVFHMKSDIFLPSLILDIFRPKVYVAYSRSYFSCPISNSRLTIDSPIEYGFISGERDVLLVSSRRLSTNAVIELKYNYTSYFSTSAISQLTSSFGLISTRFSKYCSGIEYFFS